MNEYDQIMFQMFKDFKFDPKKYIGKIFISKKHIRDIQKKVMLLVSILITIQHI